MEALFREQHHVDVLIDHHACAGVIGEPTVEMETKFGKEGSGGRQVLDRQGDEDHSHPGVPPGAVEIAVYRSYRPAWTAKFIAWQR
jgi:hypothetical protein